MMRHRLGKLLLLTILSLPAILPTSCNKTLLQELTPFLIDGSNGPMVDFIFAAAPFVLP